MSFNGYAVDAETGEFITPGEFGKKLKIKKKEIELKKISPDDEVYNFLEVTKKSVSNNKNFIVHSLNLDKLYLLECWPSDVLCQSNILSSDKNYNQKINEAETIYFSALITYKALLDLGELNTSCITENKNFFIKSKKYFW